ncbi:MAG: 50S ribosomal L9 C-terminal domain-containing protein [Planctomycetaceae bacterium]
MRLEGPIKELGMYTVKLKFHEKVQSEVKVWVVPSATSG